MRSNLLSILLPALLLLCGCSSKEAISFHDVGGETFPFESPITAITDAGDHLLLGTSRGDIVAYDLSNGSFNDVYHDPKGRLIYYVLKREDGSLVYSVQNGGINHVSSDGKVTTYEIIPEKGSNYSAYRFIEEDNHIYAATSNGFYHWKMPQTRGIRCDLSIQEDPNDIISSRFYSIEPDPTSSGAFICSGEAGQYSFDTAGRAECISTESVNSAHGDLILTKNGRLLRDGRLLSELGINALDFVSDGVHIYALSLSSIEILDAVSGEHLVTVNIPDERGAEKNLSCRSFCLIKGDYLYVVPSGCALYRLSLYRHWAEGEEVIQLCRSGESSAYFITRDNDLYRYDIDDTEVSYRRSFDKSSDVKLVGAYDDVLVVTIDGRYHELSGRRLTDERALCDMNTMTKSKVLWHLMDGRYLYQGQVDMIRKYDGADGWRLCKEYEKDALLDPDPARTEYYPEHASICNHDLFVTTMHYGTFRLGQDSFQKLDGLDGMMIKDIQAESNAVFALKDDAVVRLMQFASKDTCQIRFTNPAYRHFSDIVPLNERTVIAFTTYNNRSIRGATVFEQGVDYTWTSSNVLSTNHIHCGVRIGGSALLGGTMGLSLVASDGSVTVMSVPEPTFFQKNVLAWNYPWGIVIYIALMILSIALLVCCIIYFKRYYLKFRYARTYASFENWTNTHFTGSYVRNLARQLKNVSGDYRKLQEGITVFKNHKAELLILQDVMTKFEKIQIAADELRPRRSKIYDGSNYDQKLEDYKNIIRGRLREPLMNLYKFCLDVHPFGYSIINEWGIRKGRGLFLMLAPLSPKIRFLEMCDPDTYKFDENIKDNSFAIARPGAEKMDFKSFMDNRKSDIQARNLEIRDLIALSAYEAIISEKGTTDA